MSFPQPTLSIFIENPLQFIHISLPETFAGFNITWIEAMSCGVQRIIGNNNGIGPYLDINHVEDFKSIEDSLKNGKIMADKKISKDFSWNAYVDKLEGVFNENT